MQPIETFTFQHDGRDFVARVYSDDTHGNPWDEEDGHIIGLEYFHRRDQMPRGYRELSTHGRGYWAFDIGASIVKAARDGWGLSPEAIARLPIKPGKTKPTRGQITYAAVLDDARRMAGFINGDWRYVGVSVTPEGEDDDFTYAVWGIESDSGDYLQEVAAECAAEYMHACARHFMAA